MSKRNAIPFNGRSNTDLVGGGCRQNTHDSSNYSIAVYSVRSSSCIYTALMRDCTEQFNRCVLSTVQCDVIATDVLAPTHTKCLRLEDLDAQRI